jgi:hypothetical protein
MDTTHYIKAPHGSIWHPDVWVLLPFLLRTKQQAEENEELKDLLDKLSEALSEITNDNLVSGDSDDIQMDVLQVGVDNGLYEEWRLAHFLPSQQRKERRAFWEKLVADGRVDEQVAYMLTNQIIDGNAVSTCKYCGRDYWREFIQPAGGTTPVGMPMIYWINSCPDDWGKQEAGHFQYDSICGGKCWDCGIDGIPDSH